MTDRVRNFKAMNAIHTIVAEPEQALAAAVIYQAVRDGATEFLQDPAADLWYGLLTTPEVSRERIRSWALDAAVMQ
jgi:hypothetical protein